MNKSDVVGLIAEKTGIARADINLILKAQAEAAAELLAVADDGERVPIIPGAVAVYKNWREAQPARQGINPFSGEPTTFKAKAAHFRVRATARKSLRDAI